MRAMLFDGPGHPLRMADVPEPSPGPGRLLIEVHACGVCLWGERIVRSVANLTRLDGEELLRLAPTVPVRTRGRAYPLSEANEALADLRAGRVQGAAVIDLQRR